MWRLSQRINNGWVRNVVAEKVGLFSGLYNVVAELSQWLKKCVRVRGSENVVVVSEVLLACFGSLVAESQYLGAGSVFKEPGC